MGNAVIIGVLVVVVVLALLSSKKHFKGEGGCCGGSGSVKEDKKLTDPKLGEKVMFIDGMHCDNCKNSVEHAINRMDGMACKVNLKKNMATISYSKAPDKQALRRAVENLGFVVKDIVDGR